MNHLIQTAVDTFKDCARFWGNDGQWIADNIGPVMEHIYDLPVGEQFALKEYITSTYGEDKVPVVMGNMMGYLTGAYGILDISFETAEGEKVKVGPWELAKEVGKENIKCMTEDGRELSQNEVYVVFRRNNRMQLEIPAPYKDFNPKPF